MGSKRVDQLVTGDVLDLLVGVVLLDEYASADASIGLLYQARRLHPNGSPSSISLGPPPSIPPHLSYAKDPVPVLNETLRHFRTRLEENQITVENSVGIDPSISVIGDAGRLQQLFSNVLENTLRYADSPGTLKIWQERTENRLKIFFEDSGPGVPAEALARLFDRLYRVDKSRSRTQGGSGLGLSICKSIVTALGGEIRAANAASGGLRIEIKLPLA